MVKDRVLRQARRWPSTQLGIGVVSRNCVQAAVEIANEHDVDLMLIPSRRQIDTRSLGGGYVEGWTAHDLARFVGDRDPKNRIILARDHGGPWQNSSELERKLTPEAAMSSAKGSFAEDIDAGFSIIHIDPSVSPDGQPDLDVIIDRVFELYAYCMEYALKSNRNIAIEVGTEEQDTVARSILDVELLVNKISSFCKSAKLPTPLFVVVQTGTKVVETRNVGSLGSPFRVPGEIPAEVNLPRILTTLRRHGMLIKQHNTDYLPDEILGRHPHLGIDAANVAPEFGVIESRTFLHVTEANLLIAERDRFLELAYKSGKWRKWMAPDSKAKDRERAIISGHYIFSNPEFGELKEKVNRALSNRNVDIDDTLKNSVKNGILRYMRAFRLASWA
ncbi:MAG: class II D-tagatose-bisphosphate aldolase, non-catalytic subunit [Alphaproteobacteria bacterium]|nr:class II D-tagatose-bisphosphate aldolase, non-catalytic subunit [Alphaproteobacteria bacterium]